MGYDYYFEQTPDGEDDQVAAARADFYAAAAVRDALPKEERGSWEGVDRLSFGLDSAPPNASARYREAQDAVLLAGTNMDLARRSYFRLNIWGGGRYARIMTDLGMAFEADGAHMPDFPEPAEFGLTWEQLYADEDEGEDEESAGVPLTEAQAPQPADHTPGTALAVIPDDDVAARRVAFRKAREEVLRWHGPETPGIPTHKIAGSNDGWHVLPAEINAALAIYRSHDRDEVLRVLAAHEVTDPPGVEYWDDWIHYLRTAAAYGGFRTN